MLRTRTIFKSNNLNNLGVYLVQSPGWDGLICLWPLHKIQASKQKFSGLTSLLETKAQTSLIVVLRIQRKSPDTTGNGCECLCHKQIRFWARNLNSKGWVSESFTAMSQTDRESLWKNLSWPCDFLFLVGVGQTQKSELKPKHPCFSATLRSTEFWVKKIFIDSRVIFPSSICESTTQLPFLCFCDEIFLQKRRKNFLGWENKLGVFEVRTGKPWMTDFQTLHLAGLLMKK